MKPFSIKSFPKAIVHFDGDAFFASVEQARDRSLKGKPIAIGGEKHIVASMSYEAKKFGITRATPVHEARKLCPDLIVLPSDFELYSTYARRMYAIARRFTPDIEEYSIDECFADITGMRAHHRMPYERIARAIKEALERELNVTFGVGLGPNKSVAKLASKWQKPAGFTVIPGKKIHEFLPHIPIGNIWGIGRSSAEFLKKLGVQTAYDLAVKHESWLERHSFAKPMQEIWLELRGTFVKKLETEKRSNVGSVITSRSFTPASHDKNFILSELSKNVETACRKLRVQGLKAGALRFYLKRQEDFGYVSRDVSLEIPTSSPVLILHKIFSNFLEIFHQDTFYRATGVVLHHFSVGDQTQKTLFDGETEDKEMFRETVFTTVDTINNRYGKRTVYLASSQKSVFYRLKEGNQKFPWRFFDLPFLGSVQVDN